MDPKDIMELIEAAEEALELIDRYRDEDNHGPNKAYHVYARLRDAVQDVDDAYPAWQKGMG